MHTQQRHCEQQTLHHHEISCLTDLIQKNGKKPFFTVQGTANRNGGRSGISLECAAKGHCAISNQRDRMYLNPEHFACWRLVGDAGQYNSLRNNCIWRD